MLQVVIIDDEPQITELLKMFLSTSLNDCNVIAFNNPELARTYLLENPVDVLISDFKMPKLNGLQLFEMIPRSIVKILISGYISEVTETHLAELDAHYFEKPVPLKKLGELLVNVQNKKNLIK